MGAETGFMKEEEKYKQDDPAGPQLCSARIRSAFSLILALALHCTPEQNLISSIRKKC